MNVRAKKRLSRKPGQPVLDGTAKVFAFETSLGWIGIAHFDHIITRVKFGYPTEQAVLAQFEQAEKNYSWRFLDELDDFERDLKDRFSRFALGESIDFDDLDVDQSWMTPFQKAVTDSCRSIPYGETQSYGELAAMAGSPKAARLLAV